MPGDTDAWHDEDEAGTPTCQACGIAFSRHLGIIGTCAEVQRLRKIIGTALAIYKTEKSSLRACIQMAEQLNNATP